MTTSLETQVKVLTTERDEYQKAAVRTADKRDNTIRKLTVERDVLREKYLEASLNLDSAAISCLDLESERDKLTRANKDLIDWFDALRIDHDKLLAAGKIALEALEVLEGFGLWEFSDDPDKPALEAITALKAAGVS